MNKNKIEQAKNILVYGSLNIDLIFEVDHIVKEGETLSSHKVTKSAGGKGANQAAGLAKAGLPVQMAGKIGQDGLFLTQHLRGYGVDTRLITVFNGDTGQALIQVDKNGQNCILLNSGGNNQVTQDEVKTVLDQFEAGDLLILQNEISQLETLINYGKQRGLFIVFNPSPYNTTITPALLQQVEMLFVNETEAMALAGLNSSNTEALLKAVVELYPNTEVLLTAGAEGVFYGYQDQILFCPAHKVQVVDTTAAGDTFMAYFIATRYKGFTLEKSLETACYAASLAVSKPGAMESIPMQASLQSTRLVGLTAGGECVIL